MKIRGCGTENIFFASCYVRTGPETRERALKIRFSKENFKFYNETPERLSENVADFKEQCSGEWHFLSRHRGFDRKMRVTRHEIRRSDDNRSY